MTDRTADAAVQLSTPRPLWRGRQDKGHRACAAAFRQAVTGGTPPPARTMLATIYAAARV